MKKYLIDGFIIVFASFLMPECFGGEPIITGRLNLIENQVRQYWGSMSSFHIVTEEFNLDRRGEPDPQTGFTRTEYLIATGGARKYKLTAVWPDREEQHLEFWEDGKFHYRIVHPVNEPTITDTILVSAQTGDEESYFGPMCSALWMLTPGGRTLPSIMKTGGRLSTNKVNKDHVDLVFEHKGLKVTCVLDQGKDCLPNRVEIEDNSIFTVDKFSYSGGRWLPKRGFSEDVKTKVKRMFVYEVVDINTPASGGFNPIPFLGAGSLVVNTDTHLGEMIGGSLERKKFLDKYANPKVMDSSSNKIESKLAMSYRYRYLIAFSVFAIVLTIGVLVLRRQFSK